MSVTSRLKSPVFLSSLFLLCFAVLMFRAVWPADQVIRSNDFNYGLMGLYKTELPGAFFDGFWRGAPLLGRTGYAAPTWTNLMLALLPLDFYMDWIYAIDLLLSSGFLIAFLRLRGCRWLPAVGGALTAYWLGSNLTLIHPGHLEKYGVVVFASATLYCLEQTIQKASWRWSMLSGVTLGWMFMHQADLALFFGLILGAYFLYSWTCRFPQPLPKKVGIVLPILLMALLLGWQSYSFAMRTQVHDVAVLEEDNPEAKWNFATQWSFPPEESLDLIAPGYWGWMSQHEDAPYYGRTGQSPEWTEDQQQGMPNFKLESVYVGILPIFFALFALFRFREHRGETLFWGLALLITFLLACGKFTPLYALFFKLPLVNSIRNPNKFLQVFQFILGILCAFGLQRFLEDSCTGVLRKRASLVLILISLTAGAGSLLTKPENQEQLAAFAQTPWAGQAAGILRNRQLSLLQLSLMAAAGGGWLFASVSARKRKVCLAGILLLVSLDALLLSREYLKPADTRFIKENTLADFLKNNLGTQRVAVINTNGLYNFYLTHLFTYHHIAFADIAEAPRLHSDYRQYFSEVADDPIRRWQEFGVKYLLAPRRTYQWIVRNQPAMKQVFKEVYSYDLGELPRGGLRIIPGKPGISGEQVVLELMIPSERFALLPLDTSVRETDFLRGKREGRITNVLQSPSGFLLQTEVNAPGAFLRLSDHYDPRLRAQIDGRNPQSLQRSGTVFAGLEIPEGLHTVEFSIPPPGIPILAQWLGLGLAGIIGLSLRITPSTEKKRAEIPQT